jgi:hypothetical protein
MKRHFTLLLATILLLAGFLWLLWPARGTRQSEFMMRQGWSWS